MIPSWVYLPLRRLRVMHSLAWLDIRFRFGSAATRERLFRENRERMGEIEREVAACKRIDAHGAWDPNDPDEAAVAIKLRLTGWRKVRRQ